MKKLILTALFSICLFVFNSHAQNQARESFMQENELKAAFLKGDLSDFLSDEVNFICDTLDMTIPKGEFNTIFKQNFQLPKGATVKKASETNNGYVQTFGIYKNDDALYYVRFTMSQLTGLLEEVLVEKNN